MGLVELGYLPGITIFKTILASSFITEAVKVMQTDSKQKTNAKKHATFMISAICQKRVDTVWPIWNNITLTKIRNVANSSCTVVVAEMPTDLPPLKNATLYAGI